MYFKTWWKTATLMGALLTATQVNANTTYDAMQALALESISINNNFSQASPKFASLMSQEGSQGHVVGLKDVIGLNYQGLEIIAYRGGPESLQYQRVKGEAQPFFILIRNTSDQAMTFKPDQVRLLLNGKSIKPAGNRRLEAILKSTNRKDATFAEMVGKVLTVAKASKVLVNGGAFKLAAASGSSLLAANPDDVQDGIRETLRTTKGLEELSALAESEIAAQFQQGDEFLLHFDEVTLQKNQMTTLNLFFEGVPAGQRAMQINLPVQKPDVQFKFKYLDQNQINF